MYDSLDSRIEYSDLTTQQVVERVEVCYQAYC